MNKSKWFLALGVVAAMGIAAGCGSSSGKNEPITLTVWHVYGGQTDSPLNTLIDEFNSTVGKEKGIKIQVTVVSNTNNIHDAVLKSAGNEPGASALPDLFISYPKTVMAMPDDDVLVDYRDYFTEEELAAYVPEFLEEGIVDDRLLVFPVAKSTEIMFVDQTLFDRFAEDTGASMEQLNTWEGLFDMSMDYYRWTDEQTPEISGDGKTFFVHDYWFNYFQVGVESLGEEFFEGEKIRCGQAFQTAWEPLVQAALEGGIWLQEGYATESLRTGDAVVSVASSASILYYEDIVTYEDNRSEPIEMVAKPIPRFEDGKNLVMQRGAGFCTVKSTPEREAAAVDFLKWLTEPENNVRFVTSVGYMPVTDEAFDLLPDAIEQLENPKYRSLYEAFLETQQSFEFYTAPKLESYLNHEMAFEKNLRGVLKEARNQASKDQEHQASLKEAAYEELLTMMDYVP